ncbi:MAG: hypothetical protein GY710_24890 [Desulfobacteraceae bacterium]|nr:hypothetical protein [Desulfobacteraceae bacterium]
MLVKTKIRCKKCSTIRPIEYTSANRIYPIRTKDWLEIRGIWYCPDCKPIWKDPAQAKQKKEEHKQKLTGLNGFDRSKKEQEIKQKHDDQWGSSRIIEIILGVIKHEWKNIRIKDHCEKLDDTSNCGRTARAVALVPLKARKGIVPLKNKLQMYAGDIDMIQPIKGVINNNKNIIGWNKDTTNFLKIIMPGFIANNNDINPKKIERYDKMEDLEILKELDQNRLLFVFCENISHAWVYVKIRLSGETHWLYGDGNWGAWNFYWRDTNKNHVVQMLETIRDAKDLPYLPCNPIGLYKYDPPHAPFKNLNNGTTTNNIKPEFKKKLPQQKVIANLPSFQLKLQKAPCPGVTMVTRLFDISKEV